MPKAPVPKARYRNPVEYGGAVTPARTVGLAALGCAVAVSCQEPVTQPSASASAGQPVELGAVRWGRDFAAAERAALAQDRPLLVLFQEVPG